MSTWKQYKDDAILFLEAGFIAVNQADEDSAIKLFKSAQLLQPENQLAKVGLGYMHLHKLDLKQASKLFEEVVEAEPHNEMAKALLGISMSLSPTSLEKGGKLLEQAHHSQDPSIKKLTETAIEFADKFLKKAPSPVEGHKKK